MKLHTQGQHFSVVSFLVSGLIILSLILAPVSQTGHVQRTQAWGPNLTWVVGGLGTIQQTLTAAFQSQFAIKEFTLDGIANGLAKAMIQSMTASLVNWINSGFQGKPAFVSDLKSYMLGKLDAVAGEAIYNDPSLQFLCSPFKLDIQVALATSYQDTTQGGVATNAQCTLTQVSDNIQNFMSGDFSQGGWPAWFQMTQQPDKNTPGGAQLAVQGQMYARLVDEQGNTIHTLAANNNFLDFKVCKDTSTDAGTKKNCTVTTPGKVIAEQLNKALGAGQDTLVSADEINEIVSALLGQLAQKAITGVNGLLGMSSNTGYTDTSSTGGQAYTDAMQAGAASSTDPFEAAISTVQRNIVLQNWVIASSTAERNKYNDALAALGPSCVNYDFPATINQAQVGASTTLQADLAQISTTSSPVGPLIDLQTQWNSTTDYQTQSDLVKQYDNMVLNGQIMSDTNNVTLEGRLAPAGDLTQTFQQLDDAIASSTTQCAPPPVSTTTSAFYWPPAHIDNLFARLPFATLSKTFTSLMTGPATEQRRFALASAELPPPLD